MEKKMIAKKVNNITVKERLSNKLIRFINSTKGDEFVRMMGYMPIKELTSHFKAPSVARAGGSAQQLNVLLSAVEKAGKTPLLRCKPNIVDYTMIAEKENGYDAMRKRFVEDYQKNKSPMCLTPFEQWRLNKRDQWKVKLDKVGKPTIKTVKDNNPDNPAGYRLLYDKQSGNPIYKYTPKGNPKGLAWKMHAYEEHKMDKYDKKMAIQMEIDKKSDLFPDQIVAKYKMLREAHLEQLRKDLVNLYNPAKVFVMIQNKDESVKKIPIDNTMRLGIIRGNTIKRNASRTQFMSILNNTTCDNPDSRITCIHVNYANCKDPGKVIIPSLYGLTA